MNAVENALRILRFDHPEYVMENPPGFDVTFHQLRDIPYHRGENPPPLGAGEARADIWGVVTERRYDHVGGSHKLPSLPTPDDLAGFEWPDPDDERICQKIYDMAEAFPGGDQWISAGHRCLIWEIAYPMVGMTNLMEYFYTEPGFVEEVFERITEFHLGLARHFVKVGARSAGFSDDLAMQTGPFFGPDVLERFFKPCYKRIFDFYAAHDVLIGQHSCGKVEDLLDFFMDVGLSSLHPVQVSANDLGKVREKTRGRLALHGGISNVTITHGPVEAIQEQVKRHMWLLGREGGYFCQIDHSMPAPDEHRAAFHEAVKEFGRYPLTPPEDLAE